MARKLIIKIADDRNRLKNTKSKFFFVNLYITFHCEFVGTRLQTLHKNRLKQCKNTWGTIRALVYSYSRSPRSVGAQRAGVMRIY